MNNCTPEKHLDLITEEFKNIPPAYGNYTFHAMYCPSCGKLVADNLEMEAIFKKEREDQELAE